MADKNAVMRGLIGGILYDLMVKSNVYNIGVDGETTLAAKLNEIVQALNSKVKSADIVDDLVTGGRDVPLSAEMGKDLKALIDNLREGWLVEESDPTVPGWAKTPEKPTYTTEEIPLTSDSNSPMLVNKLQEIITALNVKYSENNPPPYPVRSVNGYGGDVKLTPAIIGAQPSGNYATEEFVERKISEAELGGGEVDLSQYALKDELPTKVSQLDNDKWYLTEQELSGAIDAALEQAKASGDFDGKDGKDGVCVRNLLDNSFWSNPKEIVNQRGQTEYSGARYTIDRWNANLNSTTINDGFIKLTARSGAHGFFRQYFDDLSYLLGKKLTVAVYTSDGVVHVGSTTVPSTLADGKSTLIYSSTSFNVYVGRSGNYSVFQIRANSGASIEVAKVALYEGEFTLDTIPEYQPKGYSAELAECMRYYQNYKDDVIWLTSCPDGYTRQTILFHTPMRIAPTLQYTFTASNTEDHILQGATKNGFRIDAELGNGWGHITNLEASADL